VTVHLVRHAKAGDRSSWTGNDFLRPLSRRGQIQSEGLLEVFAELHVDRILSSPYVRCIETMVALSGQRMVAIEPVEALSEGGSLENALALLRKHAHHETILCSHGDIIPMLLEHYERRGVDLGTDPGWPKGCTWSLEIDNTGEVSAVAYTPPPSDGTTEPTPRELRRRR
jgi:8-oxo-dGTP diphosphatase